MGFQTDDLESVVLLFIAVGTALGALVTTCCWNIRRSRCVELDLCCLHCKRELMSESFTETDARQTMHMLHEHTADEHTTRNARNGKPLAATRPRPSEPSLRKHDGRDESRSEEADGDGSGVSTPVAGDPTDRAI